MSASHPSGHISRRLALILIGVLVAGVAVGGLFALRQEPVPAGPPTPETAVRPEGPLTLEFADATGRMRSLAEFRGKAVILNLWATWCGPCREEMPTLDRLQATLGGPEFEVVAVSLDRSGPERVAEFLAEIGTKHIPVFLADLVAVRRAIGVFGLPTTLFLDREGREVHRIVGPEEWDSPEMIAMIRERLDLPDRVESEGGQP
jgi:thiol-disulfide isomerase/thioredoxin